MQETSHSDKELTQATSSEPVYEIGFHLVPTLSESEALEASQAIRALISKTVLKEEAPRKMTLAYIIERSTAGRREKYGDAYFGFIKFEAEKDTIPELTEKLRANRNVLRFLLIETVREDAQPRRAVFASDRLEGETLKKPVAAVEEKVAEVSEEELDKSIDALVG